MAQYLGGLGPGPYSLAGPGSGLPRNGGGHGAGAAAALSYGGVPVRNGIGGAGGALMPLSSGGGGGGGGYLQAAPTTPPSQQAPQPQPPTVIWDADSEQPLHAQYIYYYQTEECQMFRENKFCSLWGSKMCVHYHAEYQRRRCPVGPNRRLRYYPEMCPVRRRGRRGLGLRLSLTLC